MSELVLEFMGELTALVVALASLVAAWKQTRDKNAVKEALRNVTEIIEAQDDKKVKRGVEEREKTMTPGAKRHLRETISSISPSYKSRTNGE